VTDTETLQEALSSGIICMDSLRKQVEMQKKKEILDSHHYSIARLPNGQYQTYIIDKATGKRKEIRAKSRERLEEKLFQLADEDQHLENRTMSQMYEEWLSYKTAITESPNTIRRHMQHFRKYLDGTELFRKPIKAVGKLELEAFCNQLIRENHLSGKEYTNVKTILLGIFRYAVDTCVLSENPMDRVRIGVKFRQEIKKSGKTEVYNYEELEELNGYLDRMFEETHDLSFLACRLNFYLGLRVGELVALRFSDRETLRSLHIVREEVRDQVSNIYQVVDHTKTHTDRLVPLVPKAILILDKISRARGEHEENDYIFVRNGKRLTARQIAYVLEKYGERTGHPVKSTHKMRKTFASMAATGKDGKPGVAPDALREILGHSSLSTTYGYIYNPDCEKETYDKLKDAL